MAAEARSSLSIIDVAKLAGVSRQTVSNVVNERGGFSDETRDKVLQVIAETGYKPQPRRAPAADQPVPAHRLPPAHRARGPAQPVHPAVPQGRRRRDQAARPQPHRLRLWRRRPRDVPLVGPQRRDRRVRLRPGGPRRLPDQGAGRAGRALLRDGPYRRGRGAELGRHRQPVGDDEPGRLPRRPGAPTVRVRRQRRVRALGRRPRRRRRRTGSPSTVSSCRRGRCCARATTRSWATSSTRLLARPDRPDAIIGGSDAIALLAATRIREAGLRVGVDIGVTGFDGGMQGWLVDETLTTVRIPATRVAEILVTRLMAQFDGRPAPPSGGLVLPTELVIGTSG